jgi:hypothetical protein
MTTIRAFGLGLAIFAALIVPLGASAADSPTLAVSPAAVSAVTGDDIGIDITAANVPAQPGAGGYLVVLKWDPAVLSLTSLVDAGWVTSGQIVVVYTNATIDNAAGGAEADCTPVIGFGAGVSTVAPHVLAHAIFHAKAPGSSAIELGGADPPSSLLNPSNSDIATTLVNGSITVSAPVVAAASETPVPVVTEAAPTSTPSASRTALAATSIPTQAGQAFTPTPPAPIATTNSTTPSTKPTQATLSKVEVPRTGSGTEAGTDGAVWWIPALIAIGAALLGIGGWVVLRWSRGRTTYR